MSLSIVRGGFAQQEVIPIIEKSNLTKCLRNGISGNLPTLDQIPEQFTQNETFQAFVGNVGTTFNLKPHQEQW